LGSAVNTLTVGRVDDIGRLTRPQSQWAIVWRQLRLNRAAMVGAALVIFEIVLALTAPWITPYDPFDQDPRAALEPPSREHLFGTEYSGRDLLSRVI
jgi:peptide/nickel transport system permease protein